MQITIPNQISKARAQRSFQGLVKSVSIGSGNYTLELDDSTPWIQMVRFAASSGRDIKYRSSSHLELITPVRKAVANG